MRKLLFFWFLLGAFGSTFSQNLNIAHHSYVDEASHLVSINSKYFYSEIIYSPYFGDSSNIVGLDDKGKLIFKLRLNFDESTRPVKIIKTLDNCLMIAGRYSGCDFDFGPANFILKLDTNGFQKFLVTELPNNKPWPDYLRDGVQYPDSSYYFLTDSLILHFSKSGQFISQSGNGLWGSGSMAVTNNGNLLVNGYDTNFVFNLLELNPSGSQVKRQISVDYNTITAHPTSGEYYCISAGNIIKINSSLMPVATSFTSIVNNISISKFFIKNDSVFFAGINDLSMTPVYGILNTQLIPLNIIQSNYKKVRPSGITIDNQNRISIIANASSTIGVKPNFSWPQNFSTAFYRFPITGGFLSTPDIGVKSFSLVSAEKNTHGDWVVNLRVNIKNYSADSILNFYLNSESTQNICGYSLFHKFYNATIPPYGMVAVETGPVQSWLLGLASDTGAYIFKREVCLYTSVPNQKSDAEISNDASCSRVSKADTIVERSIPESPYGIYPNPFDQTLTIQLTSEIEEISLHNLLGQLIWQSAVNAKTYRLYDFMGAEGVYFLSIKTSDGIQIKKVVKE